MKLAATRQQVEVVNDQRGCPTYTDDLASAIVQLCHANAEGVIHATNSGDCTWYDFAREILKLAGCATKVFPTTSDKFVRAAARPRYSVLSPASLLAYGISMRPWKLTLPYYLTERSRGTSSAP